MSASAELQKAIYDALVADPTVHSFVADRIYDKMPAVGAYPCVTFGPSDEVTNDADCITGEDHSVQIDIWCRDQGRLNPCKKIVGAVKAALHDADLPLPDPYALVFIRVEFTQTMADPDGVSAHGVVSVAAAIDQA